MGLNPVVAHMGNFFVIAANKVAGNAIVFVNFLTLMQTTIRTTTREKYYYGRNLFMVSVSESPYDLPIYPRLFRASKHDSVLLVSTYQ